MSLCALIAAAGLSSRMGEYKPMLSIGSDTVSRHVVNTFRLAGVDEIIVITGHNAQQLRSHLSDYPITFLHNDQYQSTDMFYSVKIGLSHAVERHDRILFTPVDVPLAFLPSVWTLIQCSAPLARLTYQGKGGHPLLLSSAVARTLLADEGEGGLKGAISRCGIPMVAVEASHPGVLYDADTPEDFRALTDLYSTLSCSDSFLPDDKEIQRLYTVMNTPQNVIDHCAAVERKADELAAQLTVPVDRPLLRAACLLHDMAKTVGRLHPLTAAEFLRRSGYPKLGNIIAQHHDLQPQAAVEAQLLYLADKLIQGTRQVSLHQRFARSKEKCLTSEALRLWDARYQHANNIVTQYGFNIE